MAFREGLAVFAQPGALPPQALHQMITAVRDLVMNQVRARAKVGEHNGQTTPSRRDGRPRRRSTTCTHRSRPWWIKVAQPARSGVSRPDHQGRDRVAGVQGDPLRILRDPRVDCEPNRAGHEMRVSAPTKTMCARPAKFNRRSIGRLRPGRGGIRAPGGGRCPQACPPARLNCSGPATPYHAVPVLPVLPVLPHLPARRSCGQTVSWIGSLKPPGVWMSPTESAVEPLKAYGQVRDPRRRGRLLG